MVRQLSALLAAASAVFALDPAIRVSQYHKRYWHAEQGLPHSYVIAIAEDARGFLMVGTDEGLARFDGLSFRPVRAGPALRLPQRWISALTRAGDGSLWIGTFDGLVLQRPARTRGRDPRRDPGHGAPLPGRGAPGDLGPCVPRSAAFRMDGWMIWCSTVVRDPGGLCHMYFSRWREALGFDAWVTHSEIAHATAERPEGPFTFREAALPARGGAFWDGHVTHNPCVLEFEGKYYLYYTGNYGPATWTPDRFPGDRADWWVHRNHQRIGVAVAGNPAGPWKRSNKPLIDTGPDTGTTITGVPCVTPRREGGFLLAYKTIAPGPGNFGGGVFHYVAVSDSPLGPFRRHPRPMVDKSRIFHRRFDFHIDDHVEWFQGGRYYAIVKDHDAPFLTPHGRCLYLLESADGLDWRVSANTLVTPFELEWDDGVRQKFERLEMPKLFLEGGQPGVLYLAAKPAGSGPSFNVAVPLRREPAIQPEKP